MRDIIERVILCQTKLSNNEPISSDDIKDFQLTIRILSYIKNYEGSLKLKKKRKQYSNYRFSDEREWRFVPSIAELSNNINYLILSHTEYENKNEYTNITGNKTIPITIKDIKYIIVEKESQIDDMREKIIASFGPDDQDINKINFFTAKQCENDFFGLAHDIEEPFTL